MSSETNLPVITSDVEAQLRQVMKDNGDLWAPDNIQEDSDEARAELLVSLGLEHVLVNDIDSVIRDVNILEILVGTHRIARNIGAPQGSVVARVVPVGSFVNGHDHA